MRITPDFTILVNAVKNFTAIKPFPSLTVNYEFEPLDDELEEGVEVTAGEVDIDEGLLSYKGRQVLLYIKDHTSRFDATLQNPARGYKFHFAHCKALQDMHNKGRSKRYVARNGIGKNFVISTATRPGEEFEAELHVCQFCLSKINYKNSAVDAAARKKNAENFNLKEFFSTFSSLFKYPAKNTIEDNVGYTKDWKQVSEKLRKAHNYQCSDCSVSLLSHKNLCHVHHKNGVKSDNALSNLLVLCADCHRKAHNGFIYVSHADMQVITSLRRDQGLASDSSWDEVFDLIDPALLGGLKLVEQEGMPPPIVGYEITQGSTGSVVLQLEAAWPDKRIGIVLKKTDEVERILSGWQIWSFADLLSDN